ncbi:hypothetical protein [Frankia sp. AgW1.1]|uniref:hypothetical protein n=1 Tax=Frankia sp. AgW1.1 TaxID=1836971 RepID=UPI00193311F7|nr:hypothetical protein [Frankia sp. AgW1.1]MBL7487128.1 hypothetical protein [Frankia sp. AgW1.1]
MPVDIAVQSELDGLLHDFFVEFHHPDDLPGDHPFIVARLMAEYHERTKTDMVGARPKPGSKPPTSLLPLSIAEEISDEIRYWYRSVHPAPPVVVGLGPALEQLAFLAAGHRSGPNVVAALRGLMRSARICLDWDKEPYLWREGPGEKRRCPLCGGRLLWDPSNLRVLCGGVDSRGPFGCHWDEKHQACRLFCKGDETTPGCGLDRDPACKICAGFPPVDCRRSEGSLRHGWYAGFNELHGLFGWDEVAA